jgi:hypothetical protein
VSHRTHCHLAQQDQLHNVAVEHAYQRCFKSSTSDMERRTINMYALGALRLVTFLWI